MLRSRNSLVFQMSGIRRFAVATQTQTPKTRRFDNDIQRIENERYSMHDIKTEFKTYEGGKVTLKKDDTSGIAYITFEHAEKKNAMSGKMMVDFNDIVRDLESWKTGKGIIINGKGGTLCSGGYRDTESRVINAAGGLRMTLLNQDTVLRLQRLPLVSVCMITGKALGGGAELSLATDFRLMSPSSEIRFTHAKIGIVTAGGGGTLLKRLVGHKNALDLLLTSRKISPEEAVAIGLADKIIGEEGDDDNALLTRTRGWLENLISGTDPLVVQAIKGIIVGDDFENERNIFVSTFGGQSQKISLTQNIKYT